MESGGEDKGAVSTSTAAEGKKEMASEKLKAAFGESQEETGFTYQVANAEVKWTLFYQDTTRSIRDSRFCEVRGRRHLHCCSFGDIWVPKLPAGPPSSAN